MNLVSVRALVPHQPAAGIAGEYNVLLELPGPYILGIQVWTSEVWVQQPVVLAVSFIHLRLLEPPSTKIFPEPSANILIPVTETLRAVAAPDVFRDGWFWPAQSLWSDFHIICSGDPRNRVLLQIRNDDPAIDITTIVNLKVAAKPPEETAIQLVKEMNAGIERWMSASEKRMRDTLEAALRQRLVIQR